MKKRSHRIDWLNSERRPPVLGVAPPSKGAKIFRGIAILVTVAAFSVSGIFLGAGVTGKLASLQAEEVRAHNAALSQLTGTNSLGEYSSVVLENGGENHFNGLYFTNIDINEWSPEERVDLALFDAFIDDFIKTNPHPNIVAVTPPDASTENIRKLFALWEYITGTAKNSVSRNDALVTAASLIHYSDQYRIPLALAVAVAQTESSFRPEATSSAGAVGPMQVMWTLHYGLLSTIGITSREQLFSPDNGVHAGCLLLSRYIEAEKSVTGGLKRYYGELSSQYVGTVYAHRHSYELFSTGISRNWAATLQTERANWVRLASGSSSRSASTPKASSKVSRTTSHVKTPPAPTPSHTSGTVYKGGTITIRYGNGMVKEWKGEDESK